ncbi:Inorganic pyrophosphatase [Amphibalanus amphitrite]|uniref:inorganic diphosphatase n=1 Tax=Amphibalanus amphitrite TaxID=1232801 RepID=A0A6A4WF75_AMPAM|nr:Inorganic pyrophosphatase [Amphibalanus amphitrite]
MTALNSPSTGMGSPVYVRSLALHLRSSRLSSPPVVFTTSKVRAFISVDADPVSTSKIATGERLNPIKQDTKKGKLRYVANVFPHHGYIWNYGALPQTWENPHSTDESTGCKGDNDPIDVCELGTKVCRRGEVIQVKVLGVLAMIDEGETDWKLLAINTDDPLADKLNDVSDVEKHLPGYLQATVEWFRLYKVPDGKPENQFAFSGAAKDREFAHGVISETAAHWRELVSGKADAHGLDTHAVTVDSAQMKLTVAEAEALLAAAPSLHPPAALDGASGQWGWGVTGGSPHCTRPPRWTAPVVSVGGWVGGGGGGGGAEVWTGP